MQEELLLLANPNGKNVTPQKIKRLQDIFLEGKGKLQTTLIVTKNLSQLEKVITEYKRGGTSTVGIIGGDGTVMHTRTLIENIWGYAPRYAFFPLGTMNNIHRALGLGRSDSSIRLAQHMVTAAGNDALKEYTISFPSLDANGRKGFNIGFGLIPKLLWLYYGHTAKQYRELEEALQHSPPKEYQAKYKEITKKQETDLFDLLSEERGLWGAVKTTLRLMNGLRNYTDERYLLHKPLSGGISFDGQRQHFPKAPLGLYISCYQETNLGLGPFNPKPAPEAGKEEGKFQAVVPYGNPFSIMPQLLKVIAGGKLSNAVYQQVSSAELPSEKFAQVDGEIILEKGFKVSYDRKREIICLPAAG
ncbi:MAG: acylglycerol kinase family protein [Nanoarchaeota archaeon]|nr:acylglycerol kinase family protein [Nanoarchaeota archaeon]